MTQSVFWKVLLIRSTTVHACRIRSRVKARLDSLVIAKVSIVFGSLIILSSKITWFAGFVADTQPYELVSFLFSVISYEYELVDEESCEQYVSTGTHATKHLAHDTTTTILLTRLRAHNPKSHKNKSPSTRKLNLQTNSNTPITTKCPVSDAQTHLRTHMLMHY